MACKSETFKIIYRLHLSMEYEATTKDEKEVVTLLDKDYLLIKTLEQLSKDIQYLAIAVRGLK